ncbi:peptidase C1B, bleomycin hydrolase [Thelonectria olida]|uniref:Cysteine proteinase 1, mitochondrial n=1 Tax=Thelonectria olida TaxID=1576542 RepID=A0A9P8WCB9_9HYPO|nr:peptidase C1B, bleomycin hydrolase [Thelonectria olida]
MGADQSKLVEPTMHEKAVLERLRTLQMEDDYVEVTSDSEKATVGSLMREAEGLPVPVLQSWQTDILKDPKNKLALTALSGLNPRQVLTSMPTVVADQQIYNVKIPFEGAPITNQRSSGRCWLFASTNVFRVALMKRYNLDSFELSQAYLFYWDKLEKSNWFLEQIIDTADEDLEGRLVQTLLGDIVSDGGQWDMVYNLVDKYGVVPQALYPDSYNAMNSGVLNTIVKTKLREFALKLRALVNSNDVTAAALSSAKEKMLREISLIMTLLLGPPPSPDDEFTWQYNDKDGKAQEIKITPKNFAVNTYSNDFKYATYHAISNMISLVHDPRHETFTPLTVSRLGNIVGGRGISYVNVDMDTLKGVCIKMLKAGLPIFFGSDVGKFSDSKSGIMDLDLFDYDLGFNTSLLGMNKAQRLMTGESQMTHAMVLTAVHVDEETGKPVRWRVQNSWGTDAGDKGWFVMSDAWMDEFVYQAVVDLRLCGKDVRQVLKKKPTVLPLWDPMGSLA